MCYVNVRSIQYFFREIQSRFSAFKLSHYPNLFLVLHFARLLEFHQRIDNRYSSINFMARSRRFLAYTYYMLELIHAYMRFKALLFYSGWMKLREITEIEENLLFIAEPKVAWTIIGSWQILLARILLEIVLFTL